MDPKQTRIEMDYRTILDEAYSKAENMVARDKGPQLEKSVLDNIQTIVDKAETSKAVLAVAVTLLAHKIAVPEDDIRYHQKEIGNFSGRTIDSRFITPFLKEKSFPAMAESGWLTRSLEQKAPYDLNYPGAVRPSSLKEAFLHLVNSVQCEGTDAVTVLEGIFTRLIIQRDSRNIDLAKPHSLSIAGIIKVLRLHFDYPYQSHGASRLPTLAIYAAYQCMMEEVTRYKGKTLCPLESHTSPDARSGQIGDIQINDGEGEAFEGVEIKHNIVITKGLVERSYSKFFSHRTDRYYLLTTADMSKTDRESIDAEIAAIAHKHGCQVIVNGVYSTLLYYLRLLRDPADFIERYVALMATDEGVKFPQQEAWNKIIAELGQLAL